MEVVPELETAYPPVNEVLARVTPTSSQQWVLVVGKS